MDGVLRENAAYCQSSLICTRFSSLVLKLARHVAQLSSCSVGPTLLEEEGAADALAAAAFAPTIVGC